MDLGWRMVNDPVSGFPRENASRDRFRTVPGNHLVTGSRYCTVSGGRTSSKPFAIKSWRTCAAKTSITSRASRPRNSSVWMMSSSLYCSRISRPVSTSNPTYAVFAPFLRSAEAVNLQTWVGQTCSPWR